MYEPEINLSPEAIARFERLRVARRRLADDRKIPAYCVCNDRTLRLIAIHAPADPASLMTVKGMGPHKVGLYGEAILAAVKGDGNVSNPS